MNKNTNLLKKSLINIVIQLNTTARKIFKKETLNHTFFAYLTKIVYLRFFTLSLCLTLTSCGGGGSSTNTIGDFVISPTGTTGWNSEPMIYGSCCYYSSLIFADKDVFRIYTNTGSGGDGKMHLYEGTVDGGVAARGPVLTITEPNESYIRTLAVVRHNSRYYALLFTGTGYPTTNGYAPSWAESSDGIIWEFKGSVNPFNSRPFSSSLALTVDEQGRFRSWTDSAGGTLREMSSQDGLNWQALGDIWPKSLPVGEAVFPTATRTPKGTMLAVADKVPSTKIRVLWQCHGETNFRVIEENSPIHFGQKGTSLAWDGQMIHAFSRGAHWTRSEPNCP